MSTEDMQEQEPAYKLSLTGEGITLEQEVGKDTALAIINVVLGGRIGNAGASGGEALRGGGAASGVSGSGGSGGDGDDRMTPGEFIDELGARTNSEKMVGFGVFMQSNRGQGNFTREDLKAMFREAHETPPGNFARDFQATLAQRWIAQEADSADRYYVTTTGKKAVEDGFASARKRKPVRRKAASRASSGDGEG